eukprot:6899268-Alexandrium_andersonii.AAC.1
MSSEPTPWCPRHPQIPRPGHKPFAPWACWEHPPCLFARSESYQKSDSELAERHAPRTAVCATIPTTSLQQRFDG